MSFLAVNPAFALDSATTAMGAAGMSGATPINSFLLNIASSLRSNFGMSFGGSVAVAIALFSLVVRVVELPWLVWTKRKEKKRNEKMQLDLND